MVIVFFALELLELNASKLGDTLLDDLFVIKWAPEESDVSGAAALHHVQRVVDSLFLGNKPCVDLKCACLLRSVVSTVIVDVKQKLLELVLGSSEQLS